MSLREELLDAVANGLIGTDGVLTRQEFMAFFTQHPENYTGVFLSNSEMDTAQHSPSYEKFTRRIDKGVYEIHPDTLRERLSTTNT